jgi:hypothetical protein
MSRQSHLRRKAAAAIQLSTPLLAVDPVQQSSMAECIVPSRVWTVIATAALDVRSQILVNKIAVRLSPGCIYTLNIIVVRIDGLKSWSDAEALLLGDYRKDTLPAPIGRVWDGVITSVEFACILGAGMSVSI